MSDTQTAARAATGAEADRRNPHGSFIWYELLTADPDAAADFYGKVVGWTSAPFGGEDDEGAAYTIFSAGSEGVAGLMKNSMPTGPIWLGYIGVDDVDAAVAKLEQAGGTVHRPAWDTEGVGRMAFVADPQGVAFYLMSGVSPEPSNAFSPMVDGHGSWNELVTTDQAAALQFYASQFGWEKGDAMPMPVPSDAVSGVEGGEAGDYRFLNHHGAMIGAVMNRMDDSQRPMWNYYFRVPSIAAAADTIRANGGTITYGPQEVPGGDFVINAIDPQGASFGLVGPRIGRV